LTDDRYVHNYHRYFQKHGKSPCSYLIASWYLKRLGILPINNVKKLTQEEKPFVAQKIINILDKKYKDNEDRALELIKNSKFANYIDNIFYYYY